MAKSAIARGETSYKSGLMQGRLHINPNTTKMDRVELKKDIERRRARDSEKVVGVFKNLETPGGSVRFAYKRYHGDNFEVYELFDGETYELTRGVARHLNNNCFYMEYKHHSGQNGETGMRSAYNDGRLRGESIQVARKVHRFSFHSLDYMEDDLDVMPAKSLYTVGTPSENLDIKS